MPDRSDAATLGTLHVSLLLDHSLPSPRAYGAVLIACAPGRGWAAATAVAGLMPDVLVAGIDRLVGLASFTVAAILTDDEPLASPEVLAWCGRFGRVHVARSPLPVEVYRLQDDLAVLLGSGFGARCQNPAIAEALARWNAQHSLPAATLPR